MTRTIPDLTDSNAGPEGLAAAIRAATDGAHRDAEGTRFIGDLLAGRLPLSAYARMAVQHHSIYTEIERATAASTDPVVAPFLAPELTRLPALRADLEFLAGPEWADDLPVLPATVAYSNHLRVVCAEWSGGLLAHHYVRYLGDLSGGRLLSRALRRIYGFTDDRGTEFYRFPGIADPKEFKERYRALLDGLPWDEAERGRLIDEIVVAYRHNTAVLLDLGEA